MYNPNDDPDVISGLCDDAKKEMATYPGPSHMWGAPSPATPALITSGNLLFGDAGHPREFYCQCAVRASALMSIERIASRWLGQPQKLLSGRAPPGLANKKPRG